MASHPQEQHPAKNEEQIPDIDLLSLAEERAASAPIEDFGVIQESMMVRSSRTVPQVKRRKCWPARSTTTTTTPDQRMRD